MLRWLVVLLALVAPALAQVDVDHGVVYRRVGERALVLDVYRPRGAAGRPGVLLLHGGSWDSGDRGQLAGLARDLAERGFVAATADYRLATEAPFPAAVADARAAVLWLEAHAARFGLDPARVGLFGPSAGGHLALMVATLLSRPGQPRAVAACAAWCAPADLVRGLTEGGPVPRASLAVVERFLGGTFDEQAPRFALASPAQHVSRATPPLFLAHGERDDVVPFSQSLYMQEAAQARGVDVTLVRVRNAGHDLRTRRADPPVRALWERTVAFLHQRLD